MDFTAMKQQVRDAYPSYEWKSKVDYMSRSQIYAIHSSLKKRGELPEPKKRYEPFWYDEKEVYK